MTPNKEIWAIIPVRGGSKRLPRKNIMPLAGKSMLSRAIMTAITSNCFQRVIISTDNEELADEGLRHGAEVPFLRPSYLADDQASSISVVLHALETLSKASDVIPHSVCLIQATSPLLTEKHIRESVKLFEQNSYDSLSSMKTVTSIPEWMYRIIPGTTTAIPEHTNDILKSRSEIPQRYIENGAIYLVRHQWILSKKTLYNYKKHGCYAMSENDSIDIDTADDFSLAEYLLTQQCD